MANYDRWGNRLTPQQIEEERLRVEQEKQLKIKKMVKRILVGLGAFMA